MATMYSTTRPLMLLWRFPKCLPKGTGPMSPDTNHCQSPTQEISLAWPAKARYGTPRRRCRGKGGGNNKRGSHQPVAGSIPWSQETINEHKRRWAMLSCALRRSAGPCGAARMAPPDSMVHRQSCHHWAWPGQLSVRASSDPLAVWSSGMILA